MVMEKIQQIHKESHGIYGAPKITECLKKEGHTISQRTVSLYMKELGIRTCWVRTYTITTLNSDFNSRLTNVLDRNFNPERPNEVWCTDITYIWTIADGFVYLTSIMDLYSRKIIAWTLSKTLEVEEVLKCVEIAKQRREIKVPLIIHSDRGIHFTCRKCSELTNGMKRSYSEKGVPYDNACIESFHSLIKKEWLNRKVILDYDHVYDLCFEYIETFYNTARIHSHCDYMSPKQYEDLWNKVN